ncbi:MAG: nuclear transport factor 2 family protein [Pelagimonas sp.]
MANDISLSLVLLTKVLDEVWIADDPTAVDRLFHPEAQITGLVPNVKLGPQDYREMAEQLRELSLLKSYRINETLNDLSGKSAYLIEMDIRNLATEQIATQSGVIMIETRDGLLNRVHIQVDMMTYFQDLGLLPEDAALLCMSGTKLS